MTNANALRKRLERIRKELSEIADEFRVLDYRKPNHRMIDASVHIDGAINDITRAIGASR